MLTVHANPLAEPGAGDAGGMNVYVRQVARSLARRDVEVDIFCRRDGASFPQESSPYPGVRVIQVEAGSPALRKEEIPAHLPEFAANLAAQAEGWNRHYDLIHSHYWLSGRAAAVLGRRWGVPFVHTFHTLGLVKNDRLRMGDTPEPEMRLAGEARVIAEADAIVASTPQERDSLVDLYAAHPERIHLVPPGVDHDMFRPAGRNEAKARLGLSGKHVLLFVGRLQPLKAADIAVRALGHLASWGRAPLDDLRLVVVGSPSGPAGHREPAQLQDLARELGVESAVRFVPAQPHADLPAYYQAADLCLVPSYTESFGLVALEAQACGVPVVASAIGGLRSIVRHGRTGYLVEPGASEAFAERAWRILSDPPLARSMGGLAQCSSGDYSWDRSADSLFDLYAASLGRAADAGLEVAGAPLS
jgi:D-inositol-3-phosphate glycosyltransferase